MTKPVFTQQWKNRIQSFGVSNLRKEYTVLFAGSIKLKVTTR